MGKHEESLKTIISQGRWETPHIGDLGAAVSILNRTMSLLAESPGWEGEAAKAAGEKWVELQKAFVKVADAVSEVQRVNTNANAALDRASAAIGELPAGKVPSWIHDTVKAAEVGGKVFIPAMGVSVLASSAVNIFENFLGNQREQKASEASAVLAQELDEFAVQLNAIDLNSVYWKVPEPQPTPTPGPVPDPTIHVGGGGYTPSPSPSYDVPAYPGGGSPAAGNGSSTPGGGSPAPVGGSFPSSPTYHSPSIDDGSVGTLPGYSGGSGGLGAGGMGGAGGYGTGANSGLTAGVFGGATAAGAAALRFGTGAGFGGGGMGGGGLAGGVSGSGGLLGAGGAGGAGGSAGAGASAGGAGSGAGAAGGARGGMMGGQPMGGGAGAGKKDKRPGLGGLMAPKIEDDEPEFIPLPDGARAGGRDQL